MANTINPSFLTIMHAVHGLHVKLLDSEPILNKKFPRPMSKCGVYLFSEDGKHLYVGRSNKLRQRYGQHCNPSSQHNQAVFAFKLAREATGNTDRAYNSGPKSRLGLSGDPEFAAAFGKAKQRVSAMEYRFIEVADQLEQTLLEIYSVKTLKCPYNDFGTS